MYKYDAITEERLELLDSGKCYPDSDGISLRTALVQDSEPIEVLIARDTGRIPFGTARALSFENTALPLSVGPTWSTHWFQLNLELADDWCTAHSEVRLRWVSRGESLLYSSNGQLLQGFNGSDGDDRRIDCIVWRNGQGLLSPGRHILYIEVACNHMFGAGHGGMIQPPSCDEYFEVSDAQVVLWSSAAHALLLDFRVTAACVAGLRAQPARAHAALLAANAASSLCAPGNPLSWPRARLPLRHFLGHCNGSSQHQVYAVGHCHIDSAWLWTYRETIRKCARSWASQLHYMDIYPKYSFCASSAQHYWWIKEYYPSMYQRIKERVAEGRFVPVGGTWVEFDGNIPSGESMVRQFLYGQKFFQEEFGQYCEEFFMPDTFGYSAQLPQIMAKCGIHRMVTQKLSWSLINKFPHNTFLWAALDGTQVLVHFPPADTYNSNGSVDHVNKSVTNNKDVGKCSSSLMLFGHGDGGGGPLPDMLESLQRLEDLDGVPKVCLGSSVADFFAAVEKEMNSGEGVQHKLSVWKGELYLELHQGTYTSQAFLKQNNRQLEVLFFETEYVLAVAHWRMGYSYPQAELSNLWRLFLLSQFHDVLPGTCIALVYDDVRAHYAEIRSSLISLREKALMVLATGNSSGSMCLVNLQQFPRTEVKDGAIVFVDGFSSASGISDRNSSGQCGFKRIDDGGIAIWNEYLFAEFDSSARVRKLWLQSEKHNLCDSRHLMNTFTLYDDVPFFWDAWDVMPYHLETGTDLNAAPLSGSLDISAISDGLSVSLISTIQISDCSQLRQHITLVSGAKRIDFQTEVTWHEKHKLLKVHFPTSLTSPDALYESQFGHLRRPTHRNTSWDYAKFEVCAHRWTALVEYCSGIALLNDSKYGHSALDNILTMTLLKSPSAPDPSCDMGVHQFTYSLMPLCDSVQSSSVIGESTILNSSVVEVKDCVFDDKCFEFLQLSSSNIVISSLKLSEVGDHVIVRLFESFGGPCICSIQFPHDTLRVYKCSMLEDIEKELPLDRGCVTVRFQKFEVLTLLVQKGC